MLAQPLSLDALASVAGSDGVAELEQRGVVVAEREYGVVVYRLAHPLVTAAAERRLPATKRNQLADQLSRNRYEPDDAVRRATLQLDGSGDPDVDVLLDGATALLLTRPDLAERFAARALSFDDSPTAALTLADAHAEQGHVEAAREAQRIAISRIRSPEDRMAVRVNEISLMTFSDRRPDLALKAIAAARSELPSRLHDEMDSVAALISVFGTRTADGLAKAEHVLAGSPSRTGRIRASTARVIALMLVDQPKQSVQAAEELAAYMAAGPATPYQRAMADLAGEIVRHLSLDPDNSPLTDPRSGRWFVPRSDFVLARRLEMVAHPLVSGHGLLLRIPPARDRPAA